MNNMFERLAALEDCKTGPAVAALLDSHEANGTQNDADSCPIACFLSASPDVEYARAEPCTLYWLPVGQQRERERPAKQGARAFIAGFDNGEYPELIAD